MQKVKVYGGVVVFVIITAAFLANYALVKFGASPFFYCALKDPLWAMYEPIRIWVILIGFVALAIGGVTKRLTLMAWGLLLVFGAYILPEWSRILFSLGNSCGA